MNTSLIRFGLAAVLAFVLAGCVAVAKVETGEAVVKDRMVVRVDSPWNRFERDQAYGLPTWTQEGITVDALAFMVGVKDGQAIGPVVTGKQTPLVFKSAMQPAEIAALYQAMLSRDGSTFTLDRIEPDEFVGTRGFRFEYTLVRKVDEVRLRGVAWAAVRNGELHLISYSAPRLVFFDKYVARAEALARSARIKG